jgi:hypothetical protein
MAHSRTPSDRTAVQILRCLTAWHRQPAVGTTRPTGARRLQILTSTARRALRSAAIVRLRGVLEAQQSASQPQHSERPVPASCPSLSVIVARGVEAVLAGLAACICLSCRGCGALHPAHRCSGPNGSGLGWTSAQTAALSAPEAAAPSCVSCFFCREASIRLEVGGAAAASTASSRPQKARRGFHTVIDARCGTPCLLESRGAGRGRSGSARRRHVARGWRRE